MTQSEINNNISGTEDDKYKECVEKEQRTTCQTTVYKFNTAELNRLQEDPVIRK